MTYNQLQFLLESDTVGLIAKYDNFEVVWFEPGKTNIRGVPIELVTALYQPFSAIRKANQYAFWFPNAKELIL